MAMLEGKDRLKEIGKGRDMVEERRWCRKGDGAGKEMVQERRWWGKSSSGATSIECQEKFSERVQRWLSSVALISPKVNGGIFFSKKMFTFLEENQNVLHGGTGLFCKHTTVNQQLLKPMFVCVCVCLCTFAKFATFRKIYEQISAMNA